MLKKKRKIVTVYKKKEKKRKTRPVSFVKSKIFFRSLVVIFLQLLIKQKFGKLINSIFTSVVLFLIILFSGLYFLIQTNQEFAASFADNLLRPVIGVRATVTIESVFFNVQDRVNRLKYSMQNPKGRDLKIAKRMRGLKIASRSAQFDLDPITPLDPSATGSGEGIWETVKPGSGEAVMAKTFYKPDPVRPYAVATLVKFNLSKVRLSATAGMTEPGGKDNPGSGKVAEDVQDSNSLVAAFNGGFLGKDGAYGMIVGKTVYSPLQKDLATVVIRKNEKPQIINYNGQKLKGDIIAVRQNGPMLIESSSIVASSSAWDMQKWGLTITNDMYTWRSGIGITKMGNLIYTCGPSLVPETLAAALHAAGAVDAMQLDINPFWVRFYIFASLGKGEYASTPLLSTMPNAGDQYLTGYHKDFFYVYRK